MGKTNFMENLVKFRKLAGYKTGKGFAAALGLPYSTYMNYEYKNREPKYDTLCKIADVLHVTTDELLGRTVDDDERKRRRAIECIRLVLDEML